MRTALIPPYKFFRVRREIRRAHRTLNVGAIKRVYCRTQIDKAVVAIATRDIGAMRTLSANKARRFVGVALIGFCALYAVFLAGVVAINLNFL